MKWSSFRLWLIERLSRMKVARLGDDRKLKQSARRLGVLPSTLDAARKKYAAHVRSRALRPPVGDKRAGTASRHPQVRLWFPKELWKKWQDWCELSGMTSSSGLRSVIHLYLQQSWEPRVLSSRWWYAGKSYPRPDMPEQHPTEWIAEKALITSGARQALARRAQHANVTVAAVMRGLVYECLDRRVVNLLPIDARTMWNDPDKYWIPTGWNDTPEEESDGPEAGGDQAQRVR